MVLDTDVSPPFEALDFTDFARQRRKRLLNFFYLFGRRALLEFEQQDVLEHPGAFFLAFGLRHRAVLIRVNTYTPRAYNRDYHTAQQVFEHLQFPPIFTFVSKPTIRQILPARNRKFYAKIPQTFIHPPAYK
jgi:hypothetical protein